MNNTEALRTIGKINCKVRCYNESLTQCNACERTIAYKKLYQDSQLLKYLVNNLVVVGDDGNEHFEINPIYKYREEYKQILELKEEIKNEDETKI